MLTDVSKQTTDTSPLASIERLRPRTALVHTNCQAGLARQGMIVSVICTCFFYRGMHVDCWDTIMN